MGSGHISIPGHHSVQLLDVSHKVRLLAVRPGQPLVELLELILEACEDDECGHSEDDREDEVENHGDAPDLIIRAEKVAIFKFKK